MQRDPTRIGLTGGIAAGKSAVARMFRELGAAVLDADRISREICAPGEPTLARIVEAFGPGVLDAGGRLHRAALGERVFADARARRNLEAITHPAIAAEFDRRVARLGEQGHRIVFYEAALLVEAGRHRDLDRIVVVVADDELRVQRLMARDGLEHDAATRRLAAQLDQRAKADLADYVIDNSGSLEQTRAQVDAVWRALVRAEERE